uniref:Uncharacterized protein n=1 Tax=Micrurus spixii TaxID=129469 RepID=A0A2D4LY96_9SAUR
MLLGIQFQSTGAWNNHRTQVLNSASCSHQKILRFFFTQGGQFIPSALRIYRAKTLAQILYGIPIWIQGFKDSIERTQAAFLRKLLGLPPCVGFAAMYLELGIRSVECMAWISAFKWWFRMLFFGSSWQLPLPGVCRLSHLSLGEGADEETPPARVYRGCSGRLWS